MAESAAKKDDTITSDGTSKVYIKMPTTPPSDSLFLFTYKGSIDKSCSPNVFIMSKPAATVDSIAISNSTPKLDDQLGGGTVELTVDNTATITSGSSSVYINGKKAARNKDIAKTWDYSTPPPPGNNNAKEIENAKVKAEGSVYVGD
jgi:uncharacterized Zn-binding protein involved in type VI secretion